MNKSISPLFTVVNMHNKKPTILTNLNVQISGVSALWCAIITTIHHQDFFSFPNRNSVPDKHQPPFPPSLQKRCRLGSAIITALLCPFLRMLLLCLSHFPLLYFLPDLQPWTYPWSGFPLVSALLYRSQVFQKSFSAAASKAAVLTGWWA